MDALLADQLQKEAGRHHDDGHEEDAGDEDVPVHLVVEEDHAAVRLAHRGGRRQVEARHRAREDGRRAEEAQQQGELALLAVEGVDEPVEEELHDEEGHQGDIVPKVHAGPHLQPHKDAAPGPEDAVPQHHHEDPDHRGLLGGGEGREHQKEGAEGQEVHIDKGDLTQHGRDPLPGEGSACCLRRPMMSSIPGFTRVRGSPRRDS